VELPLELEVTCANPDPLAHSENPSDEPYHEDRENGPGGDGAPREKREDRERRRTSDRGGSSFHLLLSPCNGSSVFDPLRSVGPLRLIPP
jgi:hypothetical protein